MKRIGLFSDTHDYLDKDLSLYFGPCDEIWHAGDIGSLKVLHQIWAMKLSRIVYGNIDRGEVKYETEKDLIFELEGVKVVMTHIAGYPKRYTKRAIKLIEKHDPDLFICGHSHICKVMRDKKYGHLHMNPGAFGHVGFHKMRTMLRFDVNKGQILNLDLIELGERGAFNSRRSQS